jgi:hypothetical protein
LERTTFPSAPTLGDWAKIQNDTIEKVLCSDLKIQTPRQNRPKTRFRNEATIRERAQLFATKAGDVRTLCVKTGIEYRIVYSILCFFE